MNVYELSKAINEAAKNIKREDLERQYGIYENPCYVYCPREQYNIIKEQGILDTNDKYFDDVHNEWVKVIPYDIEENK